MAKNQKRIAKDVMKLMNSDFKVELCSEDELSEFIVHFPGPKDTPYANGIFKIRVALPDKYPYKSPSIGFMTKIFHPNIDGPSGSVCLDVINQTWTPLYSLINIFDTFLPQLLSYPNAKDPLNTEAARLYLSDRKEYELTIAEYIKKYASGKSSSADQVQASELESSSSSASEGSESESRSPSLPRRIPSQSIPTSSSSPSLSVSQSSTQVQLDLTNRQSSSRMPEIIEPSAVSLEHLSTAPMLNNGKSLCSILKKSGKGLVDECRCPEDETPKPTTHVGLGISRLSSELASELYDSSSKSSSGKRKVTHEVTEEDEPDEKCLKMDAFYGQDFELSDMSDNELLIEF